MNNSILFIIFISTASFIGLFIIGLIFSKLYTRSSKEISFVRTGFGGQKIIMNGGAIVLPVLHEAIPVNMNTLRLEVVRREAQALITRDRMRVDVQTEFYLRVKPDLDAIANAAQTLGRRTLDPEALKDMIEGKFVDALRSVAAEMNMDELHEQRVQFVQKVQQSVSEDLLKNGLELESVSLTGLDQTKKEFFTVDNVFDAEGLAKMTRAIEARRKEVNDIEQDTSVAISRKNLTAAQEQLEIEKQKRYAQLEQQRELSIREAEQSAQIAKEQALQGRDAERAQIDAEQEIEQGRILAARQTREAEIAKERELSLREIERDRALREQDILRHKTIELAEQDRAIAVAEKSREQSLADKNAHESLAEAVRAEELVSTAREIERAERQKKIEIIEAQKIAEKQATSVKVSAEAEKMAAEDQAEAQRILASGEAEAIRTRALADKERLSMEATATQQMNEALNSLNAEQIELKRILSLHGALPLIIRESVKPMERIEGMKIISIDGLNSLHGSSSTGGSESTGAGDSLPEALVNGALKHRAMAPLVDMLMKEAGLGEGLTQLVSNKTS